MPAACPTNTQLSKLVAQSELIVIAYPRVPDAQIRAGLAEPSPDYIQVPLYGPSLLKGEAHAEQFAVKIYPKETTYSPSPESILRSSGERSLLFLVRVETGPVGLYFESSPDALQSASPLAVEAVRTEIERQRFLLNKWTTNSSLPHYKDVGRLLAELPRASAERQASILQQIEKLGSEGVPAIIGQMDDRRALAHKRIGLVNRAPDALERVRHYGPELVVDALDAILNQITGVGGSIFNGGSERERRNAVAAWQVYASDLQCQTS